MLSSSAHRAGPPRNLTHWPTHPVFGETSSQSLFEQAAAAPNPSQHSTATRCLNLWTARRWRDVHLDQGQMALSVSSRGQAGTQHRLHAATGSWHCRCAGVLSEGASRESGSSSAQGHARCRVPSHRALRLLRREHPAWRRVSVRSSKYLTTASSRTIERSNGDALQ